jgi:hypothetical protein
MATVTTTPPRGRAARDWSPAQRPRVPRPAISDDELRRWSPGQRRALARRLAALDRPDRPVARSNRPVVAGATALLCLALLGWASELATSLPSRYVVGHWDIAWVGFDLMLATGIAATGLAVWRRSATAPAIALGTAVMLLCDAWFDIATATGTGDLVSSLLLAGLVELPLAVLATVLAHRARLAT